MENRQAVVQEYFKLRVMLNRTNLSSNQKTRIDLFLSKEGTTVFLSASLNGVANPKKIRLCARTFTGGWRPSSFSGLHVLEEYCARYLERNLKSDTESQNLRFIVQELKMELQSLGIPN